MFNELLTEAGFKPKVEKQIQGWLMTHFAYNAGMLLEGANQNGFTRMTKNVSSLQNMFATMKECMAVGEKMGIDVKSFREGRMVYQATWWNAIKTYFMFLVPGLAKSADANKNLSDWKSYSKRIWKSAQQIGVPTKILSLQYDEVV